MNTYVIFRRKGWASAKLLERAAARSLRVADQEMSSRIRWIRSYVTEDGGMLGTVCIYQATDDETIREHARRAGLPLDEILPVADTVIVRPDRELVASR